MDRALIPRQQISIQQANRFIGVTSPRIHGHCNISVILLQDFRLICNNFCKKALPVMQPPCGNTATAACAETKNSRRQSLRL